MKSPKLMTIRTVFVSRVLVLEKKCTQNTFEHVIAGLRMEEEILFSTQYQNRRKHFRNKCGTVEINLLVKQVTSISCTKGKRDEDVKQLDTFLLYTLL